MAWFRKPKDAVERSENPLRAMAFSITSSDLGLTPESHPDEVWGLVMEMAYPEGFATLVGFADGTTSLYYSSGGGTIGAGEHTSVREAAAAWLALAALHITLFQPVFTPVPPAVERVAIYARTFHGLLGLEAAETELGEYRHPAAPIFHAGHAVLTAIRELQERN